METSKYSVLKTNQDFNVFSFFFPDLRYCCWTGGCFGKGGLAPVGPEDDDEVPRRQRQGLHLLVEGRNGFQRHHSQKQVSEK